LKPRKIKDKTICFSLISTTILLCSAIAVVLVAYFSTANYKKSLQLNSAELLGEYGQRVSTAINKQMSDTWNIAEGLSTTLKVSSTTTAEEMLPVVQETRDDWKLSDIMLYTEAGTCLNSEGQTCSITPASEIVAKATENGEYLTFFDSRMYFSVPVTTSLTYQGSKINALSVVRDPTGLILDQDIRSFNGTTVVYLCQSDGTILSRSANASTASQSIKEIYANGSLTNLKGGSNDLEDALVDLNPWYFTYVDSQKVTQYVVDLSFSQTGIGFQLVFATPMDEVDKSMNQYSRFLTYLYFGLGTGVILVIALAVFLIARQRNKNYRAMADRDKMLNLLVSSTDEVFVLFLPGKEEAEFRSTNERMIFGSAAERFSVRAHSDGKVYIRCSPEEQALVKPLNDALAVWDQKTDFTSDFVPVFDRGIMRYFILSVYLPEKKGRPYVAIITDATKEHEREQALKDALALAKDASQAKSSFLANMSHDIRTPMNAIVNMTDFAIQAKDFDEAKTYLATIKTSSQHLLRLINEILDMSRIESGKLRLEQEPFSLKEQLSQVEGIIRPLAEGKKQNLVIDSHYQHEVLLGDSLRLNQILINLLNNAVKFTPEGGHLKLKVEELVAISSKQTAFRFIVSDDGIGIADKDQEAIFTPFARTATTDAQKVEGSGLGLAICKSFTEAMGGKISVQSASGQGSVFTVEIPFEIAPAGDYLKKDEPQQTTPISFAGKTALLVEDNAINQQIACMLLEKAGFHVICAGDGQIAYRTFVTSAPGTFDIIFMDIQMPNMNGYEATKAIRSSTHDQAKSIPIVAMTANVFKEDIEKARESGMDGHIGKPVDLNSIIHAAQLAIEAKAQENADGKAS
jgi:two-component system sensor histidine kinase/response regulator